MFRLSAKQIIFLALLVFIGSIAIQFFWIDAAYEGELAAYNAQKNQFQQELQSTIRHNEPLKAQLRQLLYSKEDGIGTGEKQQLVALIGKVVHDVSFNNPASLEVTNYGIVQHMHQDGEQPVVVALKDSTAIKNINFSKAGRSCLHCMLSEGPGSSHEGPTYEILLEYEKEQTAVYRQMAWLVTTSFLLLLSLGLFFYLMQQKYKQEKTLADVKNDFINHLTHEMQTPVFSIQVANKLIKEKLSNGEDTAPLTAIIEKETGQLGSLAGRILELASMENEHILLNNERTEMNQFISNKLPALQALARDKQGEVSFHQNDKPMYVRSDQVHLGQVLISLVENAVKYAEKHPKIIISLHEKDEQVLLQVADNGIGIDSKYIPFVFDKFYRVPRRGKEPVKGFGLGLSYVKQVIELHKGTVDIHSRPGEGTTVTISLPKDSTHV